jgi:hypothetical protein
MHATTKPNLSNIISKIRITQEVPSILLWTRGYVLLILHERGPKTSSMKLTKK